MFLNSESSVTKTQCTDLVTSLLAAEAWLLVDALELAAKICSDPAESGSTQIIQTAVFRNYAAVLHSQCSKGETAGKERAWYEMRLWLAKRVRRLESHPATREEIVQDTLVALQTAMPRSPAAFLAYALQTMKRQQIDSNRRRTAEKRGQGKTLSLEALGGLSAGEDGRYLEEFPANETIWDERISASSANWRTIESVVSDQEIRSLLGQFAREHLATELQQQVFEAHFLDGLSPSEIAPLVGKKPHEIRLVKARAIKKIKALPDPALTQLLHILKRLAPNE